MNPGLAAALGELAKMGLQLGGALLVASLTVRWALGRYKSEKSWERETQAIADILAALAQMERALRMALRLRQMDQEEKADARVLEYRDARLRLDAVGATAALILDDEVSLTLDVLASELDKNGDSWVDDMVNGIEVIGEARSHMVAVATRRRHDLISGRSQGTNKKVFHGDKT